MAILWPFKRGILAKEAARLVFNRDGADWRSLPRNGEGFIQVPAEAVSIAEAALAGAETQQATVDLNEFSPRHIAPLVDARTYAG